MYNQLKNKPQQKRNKTTTTETKVKTKKNTKNHHNNNRHTKLRSLTSRKKLQTLNNFVVHLYN